MAAIKIVLHKVKRANGTYPVRLRVTKNRKSKFFKTIFHSLPEEFDENSQQFTKKNPNYIQDNRVLLKFKNRALKVLSKLEYKDPNFTLADFERAFIKTAKPKKQPTNIFFFWDEYIKDLELAGRVGDSRMHDESYKALQKFNGSTALEFRQIDFKFLSKYETHLRSRGGSDGGISIRMRAIRTVFNKAIDIGDVAQKWYPFKKYKISKLKSNTAKRALDYFDVMKIIQMDISKYPHLSGQS